MAGYVDEKVAKVTLDNKGFTKNSQDTISALEKLKQAFAKVSGKDASKNIAKDMSQMNNTISSETSKSQGLLSRLKNIFSRSTQNIDMSGASRSIERMNTDVASRTAKTSSILSRLKGIFQKADSHQGFPNSVRSIDSLNGKVRGFDASPLSTAFSRAADSVKSSLSVMDIAVGNVLGNMLQKAVSFGSQFFRGPIDGLGEYKDKLGSIQTIMTNTEWQIPDNSVRMRSVSKTLEDLNEYADKTIYSFKDMTKNIGTFTAAGVGLEDSAVAIKGISNLAAASGSSTMQASTAMYQLSQALAAGRVGLQDWNSVVNAGMGGKLFQDRLTQTAERLGNARDMTKSFRDSLKDGWLTTEVLLETLREFSTDTSMLEAATKVKSFGELVGTVQEAIGSGWATSWEYLLGGFEEAKNMWTKIGEIVNPFFEDAQGTYHDTVLDMERSLGNYRNAMLKTWKDLGGQESLFKSIENSFAIVINSLTSFRNGFRGVIGDYKTSAQRLFDFTKKVENATTALRNNATLQATIGSIGKLAGNVFLTLGKVLSKVAYGMGSVRTSADSILLPIKNVADGLSKFLAGIRNNTNVMVGLVHIGKTIGNVFGILVSVFRIAVTIVRQFFSAFTGGDGSGFKNFAVSLANVTEKIRSFMESLEKSIRTMGLFKALGSVVASVFSGIGSIFSKAFGMLTKNIPDGSIFNTIGNMLTQALEFLKSKIDAFKKGISDAFSKAGTALGQGWSNFINALKRGYDGLKDFWKEFNIQSIISAIIGLFAFDKWLKFKNPKGSIFEKIIENVKGSFEKFTQKGEPLVEKAGNILDTFKGSIQQFTKGIQVGMLATIAVSCLALAFAIEKLSKIEMRDLSKGILGLGIALGGMLKAVKTLSALGSLPKNGAATMIAYAIALRILASAMVKLGSLNMDQLTSAVMGVYALSKILAKTMQQLDGVKVGGRAMVALIAFAVSMRILVMSVRALAKLSPEQLVSSVTATGVLMLALSKCMQMLNGVTVGGRTMLSMLSFAISLRIVVSSVKSLAKLSPEQLIPAVTATTGLMIALVGCMRILNGVRVGGRAMLAMLAFVTSLRILVGGVKELANLPIDNMMSSTIAVSGLLFSLAACTRIIDGVKVNNSAMLSLITFAGSIVLLSYAMKNIGSMDLASVAISFVAVEGLMLSLVGLTYLIQKAKPNNSAALTLIAFAGSVYLIVAAMQKISTLSLTQIATSLVTVELILASLVGVTYVLKSVKVNMATIGSLIALTGMLYIVMSGIERLTQFSPGRVLAATAGVSMVLLSLAGMSYLIGKSQGSMASSLTSIGMYEVMGRLIVQIGEGLSKVANVPWQQILVSLGVVLGTVAALTAVAIVIDKIEPNAQAIGTLLTMSEMMSRIGDALAKVADKPWQQILAAGGVMVGVMLALAKVSEIIDGASFGGSAKLILLAVGLNALAIPIMLLSTLNLVAVGVGLLALAGNLAVLLVAAALAPAVSGGLTMLSGSLLAIGVSSLMTAASFAIAGAGFLAFVMAIKELVAIAPAGFKAVVEGFTALVESIAANAPRLVQALVVTILTGLAGLAVVIPAFVAFGIKMIVGLLDGLAQGMPQLISSTVNLIVEFSRSLIENLDTLIQVGLELAVKIVEGLAKGLNQVKGQLIPALTDLFSVILEVLLAVLGDLIGPLLVKIVEILTPVGEFIVNLLSGLASAIEPIFTPLIDGLKTLFTALADIIRSLADAIIAIVESIASVIRSIADVFISIMDTIQTAINGFVDIFTSVQTTIQTIVTTIGSIIQSLADTIQVIFQSIASIVDSVIQGIVSAIQAFGGVIESIGTAIQSVLEGVGSVIESTGSAIKSVFEGVGEAARGFGDGIKSALEGVSQVFESIGSAIRNALDGVAGIIEAVGKAIKDAGEGFKRFGQGVKLAGDNGLAAAAGIAAVAAAVTGLGSASYAGNLVGFTKDLKSLADTVKQFNGIGGSLSAVATGFMMIGTSISAMSGTIPTLSTGFQQLQTSISTMAPSMQPLAATFTALVPAIMQLSTTMMQMALGFAMFSSQLMTAQTAITMLGTSFVTIQNGVTMTTTSMTMLQTQLTMLSSSFTTVLTSIQMFTTTLMTSGAGFQQLGMAAMQGMVAMQTAVTSGMAMVQATMLTSITMLAAATGAGFTQVAMAVQMSMTQVSAAVQMGMNQVIMSIQTSMSTVSANMNAAMANVTAQVTAGMMRVSQSIQQAMNAVINNIRQATTTMASTFQQASSRIIQLAQQMGQQLASNLRNGMNQALNAVRSGMSQIVSTVQSHAGSAHSAGNYVGSMISQGVAQGMWSAVGSVEAAASRIIAAANRAAIAKAIIRSPSRLFAKTVGKYIPQGVAKGIDQEMPSSVRWMAKSFGDGFDKVGSLAGEHGERMAGVIADAANTVGDLIETSFDDMNYSPTITPVIDTTKLDDFNPKNYPTGFGLDPSNTPKPVFSAIPSYVMNGQGTVVTDNSNKEYTINVTVDNNGGPVDSKELARQVQQHIKDFDDQDRRGRGEEVLW